MERKQIFLVKNGEASQAFQEKITNVPELKPDEALVKVICFGLNFADVMARRGLYKDAPPLPAVLGYEVVGEVLKCPSNESLVGKNVVAFTRFSGYSEYLNVPENAVAEIGDIDPQEATALATQYVTAWYASQYITQVHTKERVLIHAAAGGVGTALVQMAKNRGCEVFALVGSDHKKETLKYLKADHIINYKKVDYVQTIKNIIGSEKLDVSFNPVGGSSYKKDMKLLGAGSRIILFGGSERNGKKWGFLSTLNFVRKMGLLLPIGLMMQSRSVLGVNMLHVADHHPDIIKKGLTSVVKDVANGQLKPIVGKSFSDDEIDKAHAFLESGNSIGKIVVKWQ